MAPTRNGEGRRHEAQRTFDIDVNASKCNRYKYETGECPTSREAPVKRHKGENQKGQLKTSRRKTKPEVLRIYFGRTPGSTRRPAAGKESESS